MKFIKKKILLPRNVTAKDCYLLEDKGIAVTEDDYSTEDGKRVFAYHAHCKTEKEYCYVVVLNEAIYGRRYDTNS